MPYQKFYQFCFDNVYIHTFYDLLCSMGKLIIHGCIYPRRFIVVSDKKIIYLENAKVATSSIKASIYPGETQDDNSIHRITKASAMWKEKLYREELGYFKFTYVRNPYERLVSCYESKYHTDRRKYQRKLLHFDTYLGGYLRKDKGFDNFIKRIVCIPDSCMDVHIKSQYGLTHDKKGRKIVDHIGYYENLEEDFKKIQEKYSLKELPHYNNSGGEERDWRSYYTLETAELVHRKYAKDFECFGYEDSYRELIEYIKNKEKE